MFRLSVFLEDGGSDEVNQTHLERKHGILNKALSIGYRQYNVDLMV